MKLKKLERVVYVYVVYVYVDFTVDSTRNYNRLRVIVLLKMQTDNSDDFLHFRFTCYLGS